MHSKSALVASIAQLIADLPGSGVRLYDSDACYSALDRAKEAAVRGDFFACDHLLWCAGVEGVDVEDLRDSALLLDEAVAA